MLYPCVELATALLFLVMYYRFGVDSRRSARPRFYYATHTDAVIDAQHYIIPNILIGTGLILGFVIVCGLRINVLISGIC